MAGVNKVILVGNLGKDPEVRHLESGVAVASFTLATSETYRDRNSGEKKTLTEWHNIVLWRGLAEISEKYLHKGDQIYLEGRLRSRSWESDSGTRYITEIVGDNMVMLGGRRGTEQEYQPTPAPEKAQKSAEVPPEIQAEEEDDLPF